MIIKKLQKKRGFVILFAVTLSAILLAIALNVANIAFKEVRFGTNARDTNNAFFAADTGAECALIYDRNPPNRAFTDPPVVGETLTSMTCAGISFSTPTSSPANFWTFTVSGLGNEGQGCANVTVDKRYNDGKTPPTDITTITSNGYNNNGGGTCTPGSNTVERQLEVRY